MKLTGVSMSTVIRAKNDCGTIFLKIRVSQLRPTLFTIAYSCTNSFSVGALSKSMFTLVAPNASSTFS